MVTGSPQPRRFDVSADAYDRFMGRYSRHLAPQLADLAGVRAGMRVVDVGCGTGSLTAELVRRVGADHVAAIDPTDPFALATRERFPGADVRIGAAEDLPFADATFDAALSQLVVHFMTDPVAGLRQMARVTRKGGAVVASVWDHAGGRTPLSPFWKAVRETDPAAPDEAARAGAREGHLVQLFKEAGLSHVEGSEESVALEFGGFDEWWEPFLGRVGPAGSYLKTIDDAKLGRLRDHLRAMLPKGTFTLTAVAWAARGVA